MVGSIGVISVNAKVKPPLQFDIERNFSDTFFSVPDYIINIPWPG